MQETNRFTEQDWTDVRHMVEHGVDLPIGEVKFIDVDLEGVDVLLSGRWYKLTDRCLACYSALVDNDWFEGSPVDRLDDEE